MGDMAAFVEKVRAGAGGQKIFLLGHSHGGLMVTRWVQTRPEGIAGAILSSPYLELALKVPPLKLLGGKLASRLAPFASLKNDLRPEDLTRDEELQREVVADPRYNRVISPRWFTEAAKTQQVAFAQADRIRLPIYVFCGSDDPIASSPKTRAFFEKVASTDKRFKEYPGMRHEPLGEVGREEVWRDIGGWISSHL